MVNPPLSSSTDGQKKTTLLALGKRAVAVLRNQRVRGNKANSFNPKPPRSIVLSVTFWWRSWVRSPDVQRLSATPRGESNSKPRPARLLGERGSHEQAAARPYSGVRTATRRPKDHCIFQDDVTGTANRCTFLPPCALAHYPKKTCPIPRRCL